MKKHPCDNTICTPCAEDIMLTDEQKKGKIECNKCEDQKPKSLTYEILGKLVTALPPSKR
jgi:formylmethanofuran dehydrogenase subunit E